LATAPDVAAKGVTRSSASAQEAAATWRIRFFGWARASGVYVIIDMHQNAYSRYVGRPSPVPLPKGEVLTIGGDAKDNNAWFITVRPVNVDPKALEQKKEPALAKPAAK